MIEPSGKNILFAFTAAILTASLLALISKSFSSFVRSRKREQILFFLSVSLVLAASETFLTFLPKKTHAVSAPVLIKNMEYQYELKRINSDRFRDEPFRVSRTKDIGRIFLIGDSFVFGVGAADDQTIDQWLERALLTKTGEKNQVYNLGVDGANVGDYYKIARKFLKHKPDTVILCLYADNDFSLPEKTFPERLRSILLLREIRRRIVMVTRPDWVGIDPKTIQSLPASPEYKTKALRGEINPYLLLRANIGDNQEYYDRMVKNFRENGLLKEKILAVKRLYGKDRFLLLLFPSQYQVSTGSFDELKKLGFTFNRSQPLTRSIQDAVIEWAKTRDIDYLDVLPEMEKVPGRDGFFYKIDGHLTPKGNAFVADLLTRKLSE